MVTKIFLRGDDRTSRIMLSRIMRLLKEGETVTLEILPTKANMMVEPELEELRQALVGLDLEQQYNYIVLWIQRLLPPEPFSYLDMEGAPRRRYREDVDQDRRRVEYWVRELDDILEAPLKGRTTNVGKIQRQFGVDPSLPSKWKSKGLISVQQPKPTNGNKILLDEKTVMIGLIVNKHLSGPNRGLAVYALNYYQELQQLKA